MAVFSREYPVNPNFFENFSLHYFLKCKFWNIMLHNNVSTKNISSVSFSGLVQQVNQVYLII